MVSPVDSSARAPDAPHGAEQAGTVAQEAQALMDDSRQMGVLNAERLAQGLAKVAARDPGHAAKLQAEIEPQLAGADRQRLASELGAEMKQTSSLSQGSLAPQVNAARHEMKAWTPTWSESLGQTLDNFHEGLIHGRPGAAGGLFNDINTITPHQALHAMNMSDAQSFGVKAHDALAFVPFIGGPVLDFLAAKDLAANPWKEPIYARSGSDAMRDFYAGEAAGLVGASLFSEVPAGKVFSKAFNESVNLLKPVVTTAAKVTKYVAGGSAAGLTVYNSLPMLHKDDAPDRGLSPGDQLARLQRDPDRFISANYSGGTHNADGHLVRYKEPGTGDISYFRRIPSDLFDSLKDLQRERGDYGDVNVTEQLNGKPIQVTLRPPWSSPSEWLGKGWMTKQSADPTNPFATHSTVQVNLFGPPEGVHSEVSLFGTLGWAQRPVETTAHLSLDTGGVARRFGHSAPHLPPGKHDSWSDAFKQVLPVDLTARQQQTDYIFGAGASVTPIANTRSAYTDLTTGGSGPLNDRLNDYFNTGRTITSSGVGKLSAYLVSGVRDREEASLFKGSALVRGTGLIEAGVMAYPLVVGGAKDDGSSWSAGLRGYAELESYPFDVRGRLGDRGNSLPNFSIRPFANAVPQADISLELWSQGTAPSLLKNPLGAYDWGQAIDLDAATKGK